MTDAGVSTPYTPNLINQYGSAGTPVTNGSEHEIAAYQGVNYTYINDRHLSRVSNGNNYWLYYDALGRCVRRILNGASTFYYYDGEKPILEQSGTVAAPVSNSNIYGIGPDEIVVRFEAVNVYYFYQDHEGSVTHVRTNNGLVEQYRYDAFGAPTIRNAGGAVLGNSQIGNRFMYTGREWAKYFGFYEYRARAYHPGLGRFMSEDPKGFDAGDYNLFRYCNNDPEDRTDPTGMTDPTVRINQDNNSASPTTGPASLQQLNPYGKILESIKLQNGLHAGLVEMRVREAAGLVPIAKDQKLQSRTPRQLAIEAAMQAQADSKGDKIYSYNVYRQDGKVIYRQSASAKYTGLGYREQFAPAPAGAELVANGHVHPKDRTR